MPNPKKVSNPSVAKSHQPIILVSNSEEPKVPQSTRKRSVAVVFHYAPKANPVNSTSVAT